MPSALVPNLNMVRRNIPREMKLLALRLYQDGLSHVEITRTTGISKRATSRLVLAYRETGDVERPAPPHLRGRRLALNQDEVIFVLQCWEGNPDISLKELVSIVKDKYGKEVSITTISRYINRFASARQGRKKAAYHPSEQVRQRAEGDEPAAGRTRITGTTGRLKRSKNICNV